MSIATEISRIQQAKADIKTAIEAKGVTVPSSATIDTYDDYVSQISGGGGGTSYENDLKALIERTGTTINIPSGVTSIGSYTFSGYYGLTSIDIPDSVTSIGNDAFRGCMSLSSIEIPSGVTYLDSYVFFNCQGLTSIDIPDSVTSIGNRTFYNCQSLTSIEIPSGVTSIEQYAFNRCSSLTSITVNPTTPPTLGSNAFADTNNCPIYVPAEYVNIYQSASGWSDYADRIQAIPNN